MNTLMGDYCLWATVYILLFLTKNQVLMAFHGAQLQKLLHSNEKIGCSVY